METQRIELDREKARQLWQDYQKHRHYSQPIDQEVMRAYQAIAKGRVVIRALDSIVKAGLGEDKLPKLAIVPATAKDCWLGTRHDGSAWFAPTQRTMNRATYHHSAQAITFPAGSFPGIVTHKWEPKAIVPTIPLPLRPQRGLASYHILFEAIWELKPPIDPMLLRRIGKADLWQVCAAWELSEVERAVLAGHRVHS